MPNHKWFSLFLLVLITTIFSCQKLLSPEEQEISAPIIISDVLRNGAFLTVAQFGQGYDRYAGIFTQQMVGENDIASSLSCYELEPEYFNAEFNKMYQEAFYLLKVIMETAMEQEAWAYLGVAQILTAQGLGYLTDIYGAIPWTQALQREQFDFPQYDNQETIYNEIQRLLDQAVEYLDMPSSVSLQSGDVFFDGDHDKWKAIAHVLQARYHNHLSKRYPSQSAADALTAIDKAKALGLSSDGDLIVTYDGHTFLNPWSDRLLQQLPISDVFLEIMQDSQDPRLASYFSQTSSGQYEGQSIHCLAQSSGSYSYLNQSGFFGQSAAPLLLVSYFEALFIEAEAAFRAGNRIRAANALNDAIRASIEKVVPDDEVFQEQVQKYHNSHATEDAASVSMEKIMTEKYKAMFTKNIECWVDVRRHDYQYPSFLELPLQQTGMPTGSDFIRRVPYPRSELDSNTENVPETDIFTPLWWDE